MSLHLGDALEVLRGLPDASVDAVVTDPPAGIGFMGKEWDDPNTFPLRKSEGRRLTGNGKPTNAIGFAASYDGSDYSPRGRAAFIAFLAAVLAECHRVAKPGARLLCWAIPRTSHWTGTAIEDAGWIIEDRLVHLFGQGFPKGASKLKPACEDWWLARKASMTVPALNVDACRIGVDPQDPNRRDNPAIDRQAWRDEGAQGWGHVQTHRRPTLQQGRWPANVALSHTDACEPRGTRRVKGSRIEKPCQVYNGKTGYSGIDGVRPARGVGDPDGMETVEAWDCAPGCAVAALDEQSGERRSGKAGDNGHRRAASLGDTANGWGMRHDEDAGVLYGDRGGASRFYFCPKASRSDRGEGNTHPTVKPTALMRWLCRLICPPGGTVLDPFLGSGTTAIAAILEGFQFVGVERDAEYFKIARQRLAEAEGLFAEEVG